MPVLKYEAFWGEFPALNANKLSVKQAQVAYNLKLWAGTLAPMKGIASVSATHTTNPRTIFKYSDSILLEFPTRVDVVRAPITNDTYGRVLITDGEYPKVTDATRVATGSPPYPNATLRLGVPAPTAAIGASVGGSPTNPNTDLSETRFYVMTYVNSYGEEGPPGPSSAGIDVKPGNTGVLSLPDLPVGAYDIATKRIYRSNVAGTAYQFLTDVASTATSFTDDLLNDELGEQLETQDWDPPPADMVGITSMPGGFCAGFRGKELLFSEPGAPHAWPYSYPVDANILGLAAIGNSLVVVTDGQLYIFSGVHPSAMAPTKPEGNYAGVSAESIIDLGYGIAYASADGLVFVGADGSPRLATPEVFSYDTWAALVPANMKAAVWKGLIVMFYSEGEDYYAFLFNPQQPEAGIVYVEAAEVFGRYTDPEDGDLYLVVENNVCKWDAGSLTTYIWRGRPETLTRPAFMRAVQVDAEVYPVTVGVYADGELQTRVTVPDGSPKRLPNARRARKFEVEIIGTSEVVTVAVASTVGELKAA
jgi:hypothetical protein